MKVSKNTVAAIVAAVFGVAVLVLLFLYAVNDGNEFAVRIQGIMNQLSGGILVKRSSSLIRLNMQL